MTCGAGWVQSANRFWCVTQAGGCRVASMTIPSPATGAPVTGVPGAPASERGGPATAMARRRYACGTAAARAGVIHAQTASAARLCRSARRTGDGTRRGRQLPLQCVAVFRSRLAAPEIHFYCNPTYTDPSEKPRGLRRPLHRKGPRARIQVRPMPEP
jgi:hypothetical protein